MATFQEFVTLLGYKIEGEDQLAKFEASVDGLISGAKALVVASTAAAASLFTIVKASSASQDSLGKFAQTIGVSVQELQEMGFASEQSGSSLESFKSSIESLARLSRSASLGQGGAADFAMIGISVRQSNGQLKDSIELFKEVGERIQGLSEQEQIGIVSKLGISTDQLLLLREGSAGIEKLRAEARATGSIFNEADAASAARFNDSFNILSKTVDGVFVSIARELRPAITAVIESLSGWVKENKALISTGLSVVLGALSKVILGILSAIGSLITGISFLVESFDQWRNRIIALGLTLGVVFGPQLIASIALASSAFGGFAVAWLSRTAAMISSVLALNAAVLIIPATIIALGALIFLLFDEIITSIDGGETAFGDLVDFIAINFPEITEAMDKVFASFDAIVAAVIAAKDDFFDFVSSVSDSFDAFLEDEIAALSNFIELVAKLFEFDFSDFEFPSLPSFSDLFGDDAQAKLESAGTLEVEQKASNAIQQAALNQLLEQLASGVTTGAGSIDNSSTLSTVAGDTVSSQSSVVNNNLEVEVSVAGGQTGAQTGEQVADGLKDATRRLLRDNSTPFRG